MPGQVEAEAEDDDFMSGMCLVCGPQFYCCIHDLRVSYSDSGPRLYLTPVRFEYAGDGSCFCCRAVIVVADDGPSLSLLLLLLLLLLQLFRLVESVFCCCRFRVLT